MFEKLKALFDRRQDAVRSSSPEDLSQYIGRFDLGGLASGLFERLITLRKFLRDAGLIRAETGDPETGPAQRRQDGKKNPEEIARERILGTMAANVAAQRAEIIMNTTGTGPDGRAGIFAGSVLLQERAAPAAKETASIVSTVGSLDTSAIDQLKAMKLPEIAKLEPAPLTMTFTDSSNNRVAGTVPEANRSFTELAGDPYPAVSQPLVSRPPLIPLPDAPLALDGIGTSFAAAANPTEPFTPLGLDATPLKGVMPTTAPNDPTPARVDNRRVANGAPLPAPQPALH